MNIYFAGKIETKNDWRTNLFPQLEDIFNAPFKINENMKYFGPFFATIEHGSYLDRDGFGPNQHGLGINGSIYVTDKYTKELVDKNFTEKQVHHLCENWLKRSDVLFAWIDAPDCYGTLVEIGMAYEMGKELFLCFKNESLYKDMWFSRQSSRKDVKVTARLFDSAEEAFQAFVNEFNIKNASLPSNNVIISQDDYMSVEQYVQEKNYNVSVYEQGAIGRKLSKHCKENNIEIIKIPHPKYVSCNGYARSLLDIFFKHLESKPG